MSREGAGTQFSLLIDRRSPNSMNNLFLGRLRVRLQKMAVAEVIQTQDFSQADYDFFRSTVFLESGRSYKAGGLKTQSRNLPSTGR